MKYLNLYSIISLFVAYHLCGDAANIVPPASDTSSSQEQITLFMHDTSEQLFTYNTIAVGALLGGIVSAEICDKLVGFLSLQDDEIDEYVVGLAFCLGSLATGYATHAAIKKKHMPTAPTTLIKELKKLLLASTFSASIITLPYLILKIYEPKDLNCGIGIQAALTIITCLSKFVGPKT